MHKTTKHSPLILMILDGWGHSENQQNNAIANSKTPNFDALWQHYPHAHLLASGLDVGLPRGQMGNSEVGHLHIGAGRLVFQDLTKIDLEIESGAFFKNSVLVNCVENSIKANAALHIFGLLSNGGVHSRDLHLEAMVELAAKRGHNKIYVHAFLDGRDTPPKSALSSIQSMEAKFKILGVGKIASICGRYYAMDRDKRWDRVEVAYDMLTLGEAEFFAENAEKALEMAYTRGETDEFVKPTVIHVQNAEAVTINDDDSIVFMNFRADRARELSYAFTNPNFEGFKRKKNPKLTAYVTLTEYARDLQVQVAYPPQDLTNVLGEVLEKNHLRQLRIAETEKYAHVTYFLNGGREQSFTGEDRILIPSPKVATYDLQPEMNAKEVTQRLLEVIHAKTYDVIVCNYANPDMVGHTGNISATIQAIEFIDHCLGQVVSALKEVNGEMLIIADHGNAEKMVDESSQQPHTAHTTEPVPFIYVGQRMMRVLKEFGKLIDVAPTILHLLGIEKPKEMTGESLLK